MAGTVNASYGSRKLVRTLPRLRVLVHESRASACGQINGESKRPLTGWASGLYSLLMGLPALWT